jgi:hydroxymethylpyrimidine/phosphomethylpyrimidine kinase
MTSVHRVLTIAGSDSGGGAGIQADLRTAALLGCHGSSVVTAVTAQNSLGVDGVYPLAPAAVAAQIRSVLSDIGTDAAKTGMLFSADIIRAVARALGDHPVPNLVVDPVMVAKGGAPLLRDDARDALMNSILPLARIITPNLPEAEVLAGVTIRSDADRVETCRRILAAGPHAVLLKGGHAAGERVEDVYADASGLQQVFRSPRIPTRHTHGTGCTLSAAIAAHLAMGFELVEAVARARVFLHAAIQEAYPLGAGHGPTNPYAAARLGGHNAVLERLRAAWDVLENENPLALIPKVPANLAEALPGALEFGDVAAFPGGIVRCGDRVRRVDGPRFGAGCELGSVLLASARWGSPFRAVMSLRWDEDVLEAVRGCGFTVERVRRADIAGGLKPGADVEGEATTRVLEGRADPPDAIGDGDAQLGAEPRGWLFGVDAPDVSRKLVALSQAAASARR